MTDPYQNGSGTAADAVPPGRAAPRQTPEYPVISERRAPFGPVRRTAARLKAQIRRRLRLRPRQALAPLRTAMWAACPLG